MSETMALVRLSVHRHRLSLIAIAAMVTIGVISARMIASFGGSEATEFALMALTLAIFPAGVWSILLFQNESDRELLASESGYTHWLLRMPIAAWKLALIPVTLKSIWVSAVWVVAGLTINHVAQEPIPLFGPAAVFATIGVWLMVLTWRPFSNGWWRLGALAVCLVVIAVLFFGVVVDNDEIKLPTSARQGLLLACCGTFAVGVWMSVVAVRLSRTNSWGLIGEAAKGERAGRKSELPVRHHSSPRMALLWNDLQKSHQLLRGYFLLGVVPGAILLILLMPFDIRGYVLAIFLLTTFGWAISAMVLDRTPQGTMTLHPHLAASPLGTAEIAWMRMCSFTGILSLSLGCSVFIFAGWALWPENRETWQRWAAQMATQTGSSSAAVGIAAATFLATCVIVIGRSTASIWPALCGRPWIHFTVAVLFSLAYMIPIGVGIAWFLQQESWEGARESGLYWLTYLPPIVVTWLIAKSIGVGVAVTQLRSRQLASGRAIGLIIGGWLLLTSLVAVSLHLLIPYPVATLLWCFAAVAIALPLVRVLIAPVSLHFGRHQ